LDTKSAILIALTLTCVLYAVLLEGIHDKYVPDWIFVTVIIGEGFVIEALALIEHYGTPITAFDVFLANLAAGTPIVVWQVYQIIRRMQEKHSGATPRRAATD
jgi:hypothetical protein